MSISVVINGTTYPIPTQGQNPAWGTDLTDFLVALSNVVNSLNGSSDVLTTVFNIANNQSSSANIVGASFDTSQVRAVRVTYDVYRHTSSAEALETGSILLTYSSDANTWSINYDKLGNAGITFSINNSGQLQYLSTNMSGSGYVGKMTFTAKAFLQS